MREYRRSPLLPVTIVAAVMLLFTGCSAKEPMTASQFEEAAEQNGYEIVTLESEPEGYISDYCIAAEKSGAYLIEFAEIDSQANTEILFAAYKESFETVQTSLVTNQVSVSMSGHSSYTQTTGGDYYYVACVGKTIVCVVAPQDYKDEIVEFLKATGY